MAARSPLLRLPVRLTQTAAAAPRSAPKPLVARRGVSSAPGSLAARRPAAAGVWQTLAGAGVAGGVLAGAWALTQETDLVRPGSLLPTLALDTPADPSVRVDPSTSLSFPLLLSPLSLPSPLALVGLGVRTVSFLRVKVYSAGFYVPAGAEGGWGVEGMGGEARTLAFLQSDVPCAMRIVPARATDFAHLRDGLVRAVQGRIKVLLKAGELSEADAEQAAASLNTFKTFFPSRSAGKGSELVLVRLPARRGLAVEFDGVVLGRLADEVVARELFASYFLDGGREISPKLKASIIAGFQNRPQ